MTDPHTTTTIDDTSINLVLSIPWPVLRYLALYECCHDLQRAGELGFEPCHRRRHVSRPVCSDLLRSLLVRVALMRTSGRRKEC